MKDHIHFTKLVFCGTPKSGKSTIISRILGKNTISTTNYGITSYQLNLESENLNFSIWDTSGDGQYQDLINLILKGADIVIIVFDLGKKENTEYINYLMDQTLIYSGEPLPHFIFIGNKIDLPRKITDSQIKEIIGKEFYFETNALKHEGIHEFFTKLIELSIIRQNEFKTNSIHKDISLNPIRIEEKAMKSPCC